MTVTRNELQYNVFAALNAFDISLESLRGTFRNGDFHFFENIQITYSDIDLMIDGYKKNTGIEKLITEKIFSDTDVYIPVSIHNKNCLSELSLYESQDLAVLECIYQTNNKKFIDPDYQIYTRCKFALLISRITVYESYKETLGRINNDNAKSWYDYKIGRISTALSRDDNYWPIAVRFISFWNDFFNGKLNKLSLLMYYHSVMGDTSLSSALKDRINYKLNASGFLVDE